MCFADYTDSEEEVSDYQIALNRQMLKDRDSDDHPQREQLSFWVAQRIELDLLEDGMWRVRD